MLPYSSSSPQAPARPAASYEPPAKPPRRTLAILIASILGLIVVAGAAFAVYYLFFRPPVPDVSIEISKPEEVLMGEPFKLTVAYANPSDQALNDAAIALTVPEGMVIVGIDPSTRLGQQAVGYVEAQGIGAKTFELIAIDGENSVKRVSAAVRYGLEGGAAGQERRASADIAVKGPAISLSFEAPENVFAGQVFDVDLAYKNDSGTDFQNVGIVFDYPQAFQFVAASNSPSAGNNEWDIGTLPAGGQGGITVTGSVSASQQSVFAIGAHLQVELGGRKYDLGSRSKNIEVRSTPLAVSIVANRKSNYVSKLGDKLSYVLSYRNSSRFTLQNIVIQAELHGEMLDVGTIQSPATLDSVNNTLTWDTANSSQLANLAPGAGGSVEFSVGLRKDWPINSPSDKNFAIQVDSVIRSLTVPAGITAEQTVSSASLTTRIAGQATFASLAYFKDPDGSVVNGGPYPPRANQATQYTIHWRIRNYSTDISKVHVSGLLQSGAHMVKVIRSNAETSPAYNSQTGRVTWDIPLIPAAAGVLGDPVEAVFQIEATPAVNQIGKDIPLLDEIVFAATDAFTGNVIEGSALPETSVLPDDAQAPGGDRKVQP